MERRISTLLLACLALAAAHANPALAPTPDAACEALRGELATALATDVARFEPPLHDPVTGATGFACELLAEGSEAELGHFVDVAATLAALLEADGWEPDPAHAADGPTGTRAGFRRGELLALATVGWRPADPAACPDDAPIAACEVAPAEARIDVALALVVRTEPRR